MAGVGYLTDLPPGNSVNASHRAHPIPPPELAPARLTARPWPAYRFVPGQGRHPFRHPEGHAYVDGAAPVPPSWKAGPWWCDEAWLHGLELLEHRYYWECHEVLEGMWHQVPAGDLRHLVQAVIQLAASGLRGHVGDVRSARLLRDRCLAHLDATTAPVVHGVHVARLRAAVQRAGAYPTILASLEPAERP